MARVALVQVASPQTESQQARISRVASLLRGYAEIDLYVLPELWSPGYFSFERYEELAEPLDGPTVSAMREVAIDLGSWIHVGSIVERGANGTLFNTAVLLDPAGNIAQVYRKIHVFGYQSLESKLLTPGDSLSVVDSPVGPVASTTCYDLRFPGLWLQLSERGAEAVIIPAAWPAARREHWQILTQARAIEHQVWVLACNSCGDQGDVRLGGTSRIIDPAGRIIAEAGEHEEVLIADLPRDAVATTRAEFPVYTDRLDEIQYAQLDRAALAAAPTGGAR